MFGLLAFGISSFLTLMIFGKGGGFRVSGRDVVKWALYGYIVPVWIIMSYVFENLSFTTTIIASALAGFLLSLLSIRKLPVFPIVLAFTILTYAILNVVYVPPAPENWKMWSAFGTFKPSDVFTNAAYIAPPWMMGLSISRYEPKLAFVIPVLVFAWTFFMFFASLINPILYLAISYASVSAVILALLRRVKNEGVSG